MRKFVAYPLCLSATSLRSIFCKFVAYPLSPNSILYINLRRTLSLSQRFPESILYVNLWCIPSLPEVACIHFLYKVVAYPLSPRGPQLPFCKFVAYPPSPRGLLLQFCIWTCGVSSLSQRFPESILYVILWRIPSLPEGFCLRFIWRHFVAYALSPSGFPLPFADWTLPFAVVLIFCPFLISSWFPLRIFKIKTVI